MSGTDAAIEALGDVIVAYKKRIAELEQIVLQQQANAKSSENSPEEKSNGQVEEAIPT